MNAEISAEQIKELLPIGIIHQPQLINHARRLFGIGRGRKKRLPLIAKRGDACICFRQLALYRLRRVAVNHYVNHCCTCTASAAILTLDHSNRNRQTQQPISRDRLE